MRIATILLAVCLSVAAPFPRSPPPSPSSWNGAPRKMRADGPGLCSAYLETYLQALASPDPSLNDGVRACVPESADRAQIHALIQAYSRQHPESAGESGVGGAWPCPEGPLSVPEVTGRSRPL